MLQELQRREREGKPLRVALVGAGSMGLGIAHRVARTPGMRVVAVADVDLAAARRAAAQVPGGPVVEIDGDGSWQRQPGVLASRGLDGLLTGNPLELDVLVESTNTIEFAARAARTAIDNGIHVVLMNAEVDLLLGPWLHAAARRRGVVVTSDAGDQHGVLARMIDEISLWGLDVVMAGNIKGFLDRYATRESIAEEARIRDLNPLQCVAYTDGTKLNIEMAIVANAFGLPPWCRGMEGPPAADVHEVFGKFDFARYRDGGVVDYVLGAEPGGGVFVVGRCDDPLQAKYLRYYKLGDGPHYLFYRPYHLCHLETPTAIAEACLRGQPLLEPAHGKRTEVIAVAKRDLPAGTVLRHGIGSDELYGVIDRAETIAAEDALPIALLDAEDDSGCVLQRDVRRDEPLHRGELAMPDTPLARWCAEQDELLGAGAGASRPSKVMKS